MKLSDLRPCDFCGEAFVATPGAWIHTLRVGGAIVGTGAAAIARSAVEWHRGNLRAAEEALPDGAAEVVQVLPADVETTLLVCRRCFGRMPVAEAAVQRLERLELMTHPVKGLPS